MLHGARVVLGFHHFGMVTTRFALSLAGAIRYEGSKIAGLIENAGPYVDESRNHVAREFLKLPYGDYLLMMDADIEFPEDAITRTVFVAESSQAKVVWGNYALSHFGNSIFTKDQKTDLFVPLGNLQPLAIYEGVEGGGTGWVLAHRDVLKAMEQNYPPPWQWFDRELTPDQDGKMIKLGEDLTFGLRAHKLGFKQVGYTGLMLIHHKLKGCVPEFMGKWAEEMKLNVVAEKNPYQDEIDKEIERKKDEETAAGAGADAAGGVQVPNPESVPYAAHSYPDPQPDADTNTDTDSGADTHTNTSSNSDATGPHSHPWGLSRNVSL